jgi:large subunit ribosomal protein L13
MNKQTTYATKKKDVINPKWYVIDATDKVLGRVASKAANLLMGKDNVRLTSNLDCGSNVIVINTKKIAVTGNKMSDKKYYTNSGYQGGLKVKTYSELKAKSPSKALEVAIKGMLPKNRMGRAMFGKLYTYPEAEHKHAAQKPTLIEL